LSNVYKERREIFTENTYFGVQGSGFRVQGSEFRVRGSGFRVQGSEFIVQGTGNRPAKTKISVISDGDLLSNHGNQ
jgi:hypothetical protein